MFRKEDGKSSRSDCDKCFLANGTLKHRRRLISSPNRSSAKNGETSSSHAILNASKNVCEDTLAPAINCRSIRGELDGSRAKFASYRDFVSSAFYASHKKQFYLTIFRIFRALCWKSFCSSVPKKTIIKPAICIGDCVPSTFLFEFTLVYFLCNCEAITFIEI